MKTKSIKSYVAIAMITMAGFSSCQKENIQPGKKNQPTTAEVQTLAEDQAYMNHFAYKSIMIAFGASAGNLDMYKNEGADESLTSCATVTKDTTVFPYQIRIDFGTGCTLNNGTPISGVINATWNNANFGTVAGSHATLDFDSFYVNGNHVLGLMTLQNKGANANGNTTFDISISNGSMVYGSDGRMIKQNVSWVLEWMANGTPIKDDDFFSFTGTASGVTSTGDSYTDSITTPLTISRDPNCVREFISGVTLAQVANNPDLQIDYGSGICDNRADVIQGGVTTRITLQDY
jgi:hypothetical protein